MLKRLVIVLLGFGAGLAGNLVAAWIQADVWSNLITPMRLAGTITGALLMLFLLAILENEQVLPWNWYWHRFWYLWELLRYPDLRHWKKSFAPLEVTKGQYNAFGGEVMIGRNRENLLQVLRNLISGGRGEVRRALIVGEPGSGKTTALERLTFELARDGVWHLGIGQLMPILIRLGDFQEGQLLEYVGQTMRHKTRGKSGKILAKGIEELFEKGQVVLLCDAADEALGKRREEVLAELRKLLASRSFESVPVVITSRTRDVPNDWLKRLQVFEIRDLNDEAVDIIIQTYKGSEYSEEEIKERAKELLLPGSLGRNPFWLQLIVESGAFERNKGQILSDAVDTLLTREVEKPETQRSWRHILPLREQLAETKQGLAWLGYQMLKANRVTFRQGETLAELERWLSRRIGVEGLRPQDILGLGRDAQLLEDSIDPIRFRHRLLQEFMTAWALKIERRSLTSTSLKQYTHNLDWWETLLMLASLVSDHTALVQDVLGNGSDDQRLFLAIGMLRSIEKPDKELERLVMTALIKALHKGVTLMQRQAAVNLAHIMGDAVTEIFGALLQEAEQVIKEGVVTLLKEIGTSKAAKILVDHLGDRTIEDHVANALVAIGEPAVVQVIRVLDNIEKREKAVRVLEEIGESASKQLIRVLLEEKNRERRQVAIWTLGMRIK